MGRPRAENPARNSIPVRFTDDELERLDRMRGAESRSVFIRRALAAVAADPSWASSTAPPVLLEDLGPLEDEPPPSSPEPPPDPPTKALARALLAVLAPGGQEELRRAVEELLAERRR